MYTTLRRIRSHLVLLTVFGSLLLVPGCEEEPPEHTVLFEQAEELLRLGDYEAASRLYEEFLNLYPQSPLAPMAHRRLANIDRQLESVMGRQSAPAPIFIRPHGAVQEAGTDPATE